jgi:hypothetical protein
MNTPRFAYLFVSLALLGCALFGCAGSHEGDAGRADGAPTDAPDGGGDTSVRIDAGARADIVASGVLPAQAGRILHVRAWDNVLPTAGPWQEIPVDAVGRVEVRLVGAMPPDVFGVFVQYFFDEGDGVCEGDPAFEAFVSNPFGPEALLTLDANPETATTCANATRSP